MKFGKNVKIIEPVNLYNCSIGDNSFIDPLLKFKKRQNRKTVEFKVIALFVRMLILEITVSGHGVNFINDKLTDKQLNRDSKNFLKTNISDNVKIDLIQLFCQLM